VRASATIALGLLIAACSAGAPSPSPRPGSLSIIATTTVLADLAANVGGDLVNVRSLVPKGADPHTFDPRPSDAVALSDADLAVMNGLGLDDWLLPLIENAGQEDLPVVRLGEGLTEVDYIAGDPEEGGQYNPHLWMDVAYAREYVERIRVKLDEIDPAHMAQYDANAAAYDVRLADLDQYVRDQVASIPADSRKLVAFHDAFPYYAQAYGLEIVGVVVDAPGQDPSAGEIADLIAAIRLANVKLILAEVQFPDQLVRQIAAETGAQVEADLYDDALTDTVPSYEAMIRWDTDKIVGSLK
jgi:ABC-type Zn uptake system ZnuABC Zn-binding protein ZnuA